MVYKKDVNFTFKIPNVSLQRLLLLIIILIFTNSKTKEKNTQMSLTSSFDTELTRHQP